jgi:5-methylcytosine-specific restriction endonuclease McrA
MPIVKRIWWRASTKAAIHAKCGGRCAYCGVEITIEKMSIDHIHPRAAGGTDERANLNPSCRACNNFKSVWSLEEFRQHVAHQVERCRKYSVNYRTAERFGLVQVVRTDVVFYFEHIAQT